MIDQAGNIVSATPSGGWLKGSPVIEELGFPLGTRGQMFSLSPGHPNVIRAGQTAAHDADAFHCFASGSGLSGPLAVWRRPPKINGALQFLLAVLDFGLSLQQATEVPTVTSLHWPRFLLPSDRGPRRCTAESRIPSEVLSALRDRGHDVREVEAFSGGNTLAASIDHERGVFAGAALAAFGSSIRGRLVALVAGDSSSLARPRSPRSERRPLHAFRTKNSRNKPSSVDVRSLASTRLAASSKTLQMPDRDTDSNQAPRGSKRHHELPRARVLVRAGPADHGALPS